MRIAVNTRLLLKDKLEGIGWFSYESLKRMVQAHPEHEFIFIFDRPYADDFVFAGNVTPIVVGPPARHPFLWWIWLEIRLPRVLKKYKADVFVSPDGFLSLRSDVPAVPVIHDLNFEHYPQQLPPLVRWFYRKYFPRYARKACRVGTVSEYSRQDIAKTYGIDPEKTDVYCNGINSLYQPASEGKKQSVREDVSDGCPYFVFVGALNPRKNIPGLLRAFEHFREETEHSHKLVVVGDAMHKTAAIKNQLAAMSHDRDVIFTGRLPAQELSGVLGAAEAMVFVPFFEGFGIPLVEAMAADVPIVCSNRTSVPEVAGKAAIQVDPDDHKAIAGAMQRVVEDSQLRQHLVEQGQTQKLKFSWDKTAERFWKTIETCLYAGKQ